MTTLATLQSLIAQDEPETPCLPEEVEDQLLSERLLEQPGTLRCLAPVKVNGRQLTAGNAASTNCWGRA